MKKRLVIILAVAVIGAPAAEARTARRFPKYSPYSAKLSCTSSAGKGRVDGPWRIPGGRADLSWSIGFPYLFHGAAGGSSCAVLVGPASVMRDAVAASRPSGVAPYTIVVDCTGGFWKALVIPQRGVAELDFGVSHGDLCRVYGTRAGYPPLYLHLVPTGDVWSKPATAPPTNAGMCGLKDCSFQVRATRATRWELEYAHDYSGYLSLQMTSGKWKTTYHCAVVAGAQTYCYSEGSFGIPAPGSVIVAKASSKGRGHWAAGIDSRPRWPA